MHIHHVGIIVTDINESLLIFNHLGYQACEEVVEDYYQHNKILFLEDTEKSIKIEMIEPLDDESTVKRAKPGLHHICYEVMNEEEFYQEFKKRKIGKIFTSEYIAPAIGSRRVVFSYLRNDLLIEFLLGF